MIEELRKQAQSAFPELQLLIGWKAGFDPLRATPVFVRTPAETSKLIWNPFCVQNLSGFLVKTPGLLPGDAAKKIGICAKGCDSKSLVALIQEKFIPREKLFIIGLPCRGVVDLRNLRARTSLSGPVSVSLLNDKVRVENSNGVQEFALDEVTQRKCRRCLNPNPVIHDVLIGEPAPVRAKPEDLYRDVGEIEKLTLEERLSFWSRELDKCVRCYACRNACPLCACQERCIAETRSPKWLSQYVGLPEKLLFHFIHAMHLAGRCTECGECERVCPMEIPATLMKEELNKIIKDLLGYEAGMDPEAVPPFLTYNAEETGF